jgi:hypothetical protein
MSTTWRRRDKHHVVDLPVFIYTLKSNLTFSNSRRHEQLKPTREEKSPVLYRWWLEAPWGKGNDHAQ